MVILEVKHWSEDKKMKTRATIDHTNIEVYTPHPNL